MSLSKIRWFAALEGLTDLQFNKFIYTVPFPEWVFVYPAGQFFLSIETTGTKFITPSAIEIPVGCSYILFPISFDHSPSMKNLRKCQDHFALLILNTGTWKATYVDGLLLKGKSVNKDVRYKRVRTNVMPKLRRLLGRDIGFTTFKFDREMIVPNGCALPIIANLEYIMDGNYDNVEDVLKTPTMNEEKKLLQRIGRFFEEKGEKVGYSSVEWKKIRPVTPKVSQFIKEQEKEDPLMEMGHTDDGTEVEGRRLRSSSRGDAPPLEPPKLKRKRRSFFKSRKAVEIFSDQFRADELRRRQGTGNDISVADLSKLTSQKWKGLDAEGKNKYHQLAEMEREEYGESPKEDRVTKPRRASVKENKENQEKVKKPKDTNAPKRPTTSFFCFSNEQRTVINAEHPEFKVTDIAKEMGKRWKEMDASGKRQYEIVAEEDKKRYAKELAAYEKMKD